MSTELEVTKTLILSISSPGVHPPIKEDFFRGKIGTYVRSVKNSDGTTTVVSGFIRKDEDSTFFHTVEGETLDDPIDVASRPSKQMKLTSEHDSALSDECKIKFIHDISESDGSEDELE